MHRCTACLSSSTAHGISNVTIEKPLLIRIYWIIFFITAFAVFSYHTYTLALQLIEKPVAVRIVPQVYNLNNPEVLICFERFLSKSVLKYLSKQDSELLTKMSKLYNSITKRYKLFTNNNSMLSLDLILSNFGFEMIHKTFGHRLEELVIKLNCGGEKLKFDFEINYNHMACIRINKSVCDLNTETIDGEFYIHSFEDESIPKSNILFNGNQFYNLQMFMNSFDYAYDAIFVHFNWATGSLRSQTNKVIAGGGQQTFIQLSSHTYEYVQRKKFPCIDNCKQVEYYDFLRPGRVGKSCLKSICLTNQLQNEIFSYFGCVLPSFPIVKSEFNENVKFCFNKTNNSEWNNVVQNLDLDTILGLIHIANKTCKYEPFCTEVYYNAESSNIPWPINQYIKDDLKKSINMYNSTQIPGKIEAYNDILKYPYKIEHYKRNYYKISIDSAFNKNSLAKEEVTYRLKNFLADVGGIMGLYLGASVLTVFEIINLFAYKSRRNSHLKVNQEVWEGENNV